MKRLCSLFLAAALIVVLAVPVSAAEDDSGLWVELLETATINNSGNNFFTYTTSATINIPLPSRFRVARVDMIFACSNGTIPSTVGVMYNNALTNLTIVKISSSLFRAYGTIVNTFYDSMQVRLVKSGTTSSAVELLSCRVSRIAQESFPCDAEFYIAGDASYTSCPGVHDFGGTGVPETVAGQFPVRVYDWNKYDSITVTGSVEGMGLNSVRASIGSVGLPYEITYTSTNSAGSISDYYLWEDVKHYTYDESYKGTIDGSVFTNELYLGKVLFSVTIDLTGVDRTSKDLLALYFTGVYTDDIGYVVQIVGVEGGINVADTTEVTWWNRTTTFFSSLFSNLGTTLSTGFTNVGTWISNQTTSLKTELVGIWHEIEDGFTNVGAWFERYFGIDDPEADEFGSTMESQSGAMQDAVDEMDQVTKPDVEDIDVSLDQYMDADAMDPVSGVLGAIFGNDIVVTMLLICVTCAFVSYALFGKR